MKDKVLTAHKKVYEQLSKAKQKAGAEALRNFSDEYKEKIIEETRAEFLTETETILEDLASHINKAQAKAVNTLDARSWINEADYQRIKENLPVTIAGMTLQDLLKLYEAKISDPAYRKALEPAIDARLSLLPENDKLNLEYKKLVSEAPKAPAEAEALQALKECRAANHLLWRLESLVRELAEVIRHPSLGEPTSLNKMTFDYLEQTWPDMVEKNLNQFSDRITPLSELYSFIIKIGA